MAPSSTWYTESLPYERKLYSETTWNHCRHETSHTYTSQYFLSHILDEKTPNLQHRKRRQKTVNISLITVMIKAFCTPVSGQGGVPMDPNSEKYFPEWIGNEMRGTDKVIQKNQNTAKKSKIGYTITKWRPKN